MVFCMGQVMSITETQYSNANVIFISPDSDNLSVLQVPDQASSPVPVP